MGAVDAGRLIIADGTPESAWQQWPALAAVPSLTIDDLAPPDAAVVIVTPHPDDEVLAFGGMIAMLSAAGRPVEIVAVTDGDASHPGSRQWPPHRLASRRRAESQEGLRRLGCVDARITQLACPDGRVDHRRGAVAASLRAMLQPGARVFTTWALDGHPDHEATAQAVDEACEATGATAIQAPVWMWHWATPADPRVPWQQLRRLRLGDDALARKRSAIAAHETQLTDQDDGRDPVLRPHQLQRLMRPFEYFFCTPQR